MFPTYLINAPEQNVSWTKNVKSCDLILTQTKVFEEHAILYQKPHFVFRILIKAFRNKATASANLKKMVCLSNSYKNLKNRLDFEKHLKIQNSKNVWPTFRYAPSPSPQLLRVDSF